MAVDNYVKLLYGLVLVYRINGNYVSININGPEIMCWVLCVYVELCIVCLRRM